MYKLIIGSDPYRLELLVNSFLDTYGFAEYIGTVQVLGNEMYAQAFDYDPEDYEPIDEEESPF